MILGANNTLSLYRFRHMGAAYELEAEPYAVVECFLERMSETREALLGPTPGMERWDAVTDPCGARAGDRAVDQDGVTYEVKSVRTAACNLDSDDSCQLGLLRKPDGPDPALPPPPPDP